jgi:multicomponent K+:H+ antiporter subunit A
VSATLYVNIAALTGAGAWLFGHPFLTSHVAHVNVPLIGEVHLPSAFLFDIGVFLLVVGATSMVLIAIAHQTLRAHRIEREQREEAAQRAASARTEGAVPGDVAAP